MKYCWRLAGGTGTLNKHRRCFMGRFNRGMPVSCYDFISIDQRPHARQSQRAHSHSMGGPFLTIIRSFKVQPRHEEIQIVSH